MQPPIDNPRKITSGQDYIDEYPDYLDNPDNPFQEERDELDNKEAAILFGDK